MHRRKFISFTTAPALGALLTACGGDGNQSPDGNTPIDAGVDPSQLSSLPDHVPVDLAFLQQETGGQIRASVVLGVQAQAGVPVTFYDAAGNILGSAVTDELGLITTAFPARRLVVAEAHTASGPLLGMRFYSGDEFMPTLYIDVLQSVFVNVITKMMGKYNVSMYVLQDYFRLPNSLNVLNIGHNASSLDQRLVHTELEKSGQSLDKYIDTLSQDIISNINNDSHYNLRFNSLYQINGFQENATLASFEEDIVQKAGKMAIDIISKASPIPFTSNLLEFAFGQFTSRIFPGGVDPFIEIQQRLQAIESKLQDLEYLIIETNWKVSRKSLSKYFTDFVNVKEHMENLRIFCKKNPGVTTSKLHDDYEKSLLSLTANTTAEGKLNTATRIFLGRDEFSGNACLDDLLKVIQSKKFYSEEAEYKYRGYLAFFVTYQSIGYLLLASSYILRCKNEKIPESHAIEYLEDLQRRMEEVIKSIDNIDVSPMPERVNIDHKNQLAWIGSCGLINAVIDFWPPSRKTCSNMGRAKLIINTPVYVCYASDYGKGLDNWKGPVPSHEMKRETAHVKKETWEFGEWHSASADDFKASFYTDARRSGKKIDAYASENGFSCTSLPSKVAIKAFNNFPLPRANLVPDESLPEYFYSDGLAQIPTQYRRAGSAGSNGANYYLDCTRFDLRTQAVDSCNVRANYGTEGVIAVYNPSRYVFFPTCKVTNSMARKYLPWVQVAAARKSGPL